MGKKIKFIPNAPLEEGDTVICVHMDDNYSPVTAGTPGVVKEVSKTPYGETIYYVIWKSGSKLALIDGIDKWRKKVEDDFDDSEQISESKIVLVRTKKDLLNKKF